MRKQLGVIWLVAIALCLTSASLVAHQITYKGTVISAQKTAVRVNVVDAKTKRTVAMSFKLDDHETRILRGDKVVTFDQARIQKDEKIAVTVDHDLDETIAVVVRLDEKK